MEWFTLTHRLILLIRCSINNREMTSVTNLPLYLHCNAAALFSLLHSSLQKAGGTGQPIYSPDHYHRYVFKLVPAGSCLSKMVGRGRYPQRVDILSSSNDSALWERAFEWGGSSLKGSSHHSSLCLSETEHIVLCFWSDQRKVWDIWKPYR